MSETKTQSNATPTREAYPSGWLKLTKHESAAKIVDALLDLPSSREFNQTELAEQADVSRQSVKNHLNLLLDINVLERVEGTHPQRYRFNADSDVSEAIIRLDAAMNAVGPNA